MIIGKVISDGATVNSTELEVHVDWLATEVPIARFDQDLRYSFKAIHRFCGVTRNNAVQRIEQISRGENDPGYEIVPTTRTF